MPNLFGSHDKQAEKRSGTMPQLSTTGRLQANSALIHTLHNNLLPTDLEGYNAEELTALATFTSSNSQAYKTIQQRLGN